MCPGSSDPFYIVTYYIKWVTTSWTYSILTIEMDNLRNTMPGFYFFILRINGKKRFTYVQFIFLLLSKFQIQHNPTSFGSKENKLFFFGKDLGQRFVFVGGIMCVDMETAPRKR